MEILAETGADVLLFFYLFFLNYIIVFSKTREKSAVFFEILISF